MCSGDWMATIVWKIQNTYLANFVSNFLTIWYTPPADVYLVTRISSVQFLSSKGRVFHYSIRFRDRNLVFWYIELNLKPTCKYHHPCLLQLMLKTKRRTFNGINRDEWVAPIPGRPCLTGFYPLTHHPRVKGELHIRDTELSKIVSCHLGLDLDSIENLAIINPNDTSNHFRDNNHIP